MIWRVGAFRTMFRWLTDPFVILRREKIQASNTIQTLTETDKPQKGMDADPEAGKQQQQCPVLRGINRLDETFCGQ